MNPNIHENIMRNLKNIDFSAKEGILEQTPETIRNLYNHLFAGSNTYHRVTFDITGKYSGYVSVDGETKTPEKLDRMVEFCEKHGMKAKINAFLFYADFPKILEASLNNRVSIGEITESEKKEILKQSLISYVKDIGIRYGEKIDAVDIFNELIYDPYMKEPGFDEEKSFHPRHEGWQKYLSIEDLCEMALEARKVMPNATFTYNDMNWINSDKREQIIKIVKKIQEVEQQYRAEGKLAPGEKGLIDNIGFEAHLTTDDKVEQLELAIKDVERRLNLPIEVTELDIACVGDNPLSEQEITKQHSIISKIYDLVKQGRIQAVTVWSQSDDMSFMNDKCKRKVNASVILDGNCDEKTFEYIKELPLQNFNFHTHTSLCGHADGTMEEYIQNAIAGQISTLGFSDHAPNPFGKGDPRSSMNMEQFENEYIPTLNRLRKQYHDKIDIKIGLESEYYGDEGEQYPQLKQFREKTEPYLDYMILGQHFALARDENGKLLQPPKMSDVTSANYPLDYAMTVVEAIKSGKYAYVAHPDVFLQHRDKVPENQKEQYMINAQKASKMICETASKYKIPLEINLGSISAVMAGKKSKLKDGSYEYPVPGFWEYAQEFACDVLIGIDAHFPTALKDKICEQIAKNIMRNSGIKLAYRDSFMPIGIGHETDRMKTKSISKVVTEAIEGIKNFELVKDTGDNQNIDLKKFIDEKSPEAVKKEGENLE